MQCVVLWTHYTNPPLIFLPNQIRLGLLQSGWPSVFLFFERVLEPPVPAWAYQADKNLCLLPRELWSCQALRLLESIEAASQGLSPLYPEVHSQSQGQPGGPPCEACQQHANPAHPSATNPGPLAYFPSITIYTWQPWSEHNMKRILVICGRLLTNRGTECFLLTNSSLSVSILLLFCCCCYFFPRFTKKRFSQDIHIVLVWF